MAPNVRSILCTKCGAPLALHLPRAKTIVCQHCRAQLDLTKEPYELLGFFRSHKLQHPLRLGLQASLDGALFTLVGHVRYVESTWFWDEYLGISEDGRALWIQYDEGAFSLYTPFVPQEPEEIGAKATHVTVDGQQHRIQGRGNARVGFLDGEFTFRVKRGDLVQYVDAGALAVELTEREVEFFQVRSIDKANLADAVGLTLEELEAGCYHFEEEDAGDGGHPTSSGRDAVIGASSLGTLGGLVVMVFFGGVVLALEDCGEELDEDGTFVAAGRSGSSGARSSGSPGRGSFGGGFSGGK